MAGRYQRKSGRQALPDFSRKSISKHVAKVTAQKPYVLYPLAIGILGGLSAILLGTSLLPAVIGGGLGIAAWLLDNTLRKQKHSGDYVRKLHEMLALRTQESLASLREELADVGEYSGLDQLERLRRKFEAFDQLLRRKLDPNELTFGRYLGMAEQLYLGGLDNLSTIANITRGLNAINEEHLEKRTDRLGSDDEMTPHERREFEALERRKQLVEEQKELLATLLAQNEKNSGRYRMLLSQDSLTAVRGKRRSIEDRRCGAGGALRDDGRSPCRPFAAALGDAGAGSGDRLRFGF